MPRRNSNALRHGLDARDRRFAKKHPQRVLHRKRCKCRTCRLRRAYTLGIFRA